MTQTMDCPEARLSLGVYVLGAIDPGERAQVDSHLATCRDCRDELAGLAGLPALLARVGREEATALAAANDERPAWEEEALAPPDRLVGNVLDLAAARRRRRGWREGIFGAAAALVIATGLFAGLRMTASPAPVAQNAQPGWPGNDDGPSGPVQEATGQSHGMTLDVRYRQMAWGTELKAQVTGIPVGVTCQIWLVGPGKTRLLSGSWISGQWEGSAWYTASAAIPAEQVQEFVITVGNTQMVTAES